MSSQTTLYRQCFLTDSGKRVLAHILTEGGYFDTDIITEGDIAVQNFTKKIVKNLGICQTPESVSEYVNKILELKVS